MKQAILIRVTPENYDQWIAEHNSCETARLDYGITDGPVYRDQSNPNVALIHLNVEDMDRAKGWFADPRFKAASERAGNVKREVWIATEKPAAPVPATS